MTCFRTNKLIALVSASVSNPLRFPGYMYSSMESIVSNLIPTPDLKFLTSSIALSVLKTQLFE